MKERLKNSSILIIDGERIAQDREYVLLSLAVACLLVGGIFYVVSRPTSLLMFHWFDSFGLMEEINTLRSWTAGSNVHPPKWIIYSLPFALWVLSYLFFIRTIWHKSTTLSFYLWLWCVPAAAITSEVAQIAQVLPGNFDILDLVSIILATIVGVWTR